MLILLAVPLFPSQAPDFISDTIPTEFWEIFHLLFIGIAVSYGLFGRKTATVKTVNSRNDFYSREYMPDDDIASFSSIFEDGFGNIDGSSYGDLDNQCFLDRKDEVVVGESKKVRSLVSKSLVVVSNGEYIVDGSSGSGVKPLNLPVRSLRSSVVKNVENDRLVGVRNGGEFSKRFEGKGVAVDAEVVKIRGVVPKNLEKKFEEVAGASVIPWRSRSMNMEEGGEVSSFKPTAHCRPQSVGEMEFERLGSRPFQDSRGLASLKVENGGTKWDFWKPVVDSERGLLNVKTSLNGAKARVYSIGSASEMNMMNELECKLKDNGNLGDESGVEKGKRGIDLLGSDVKSPKLARVLSRAKSVRTIKPNRYIGDRKDDSSNTVDFSVRKENPIELEDSHGNHRNQEFDRIFPMPKPNPILYDDGKDDVDHGSLTDSEEEKRSEFDKCSDEDEDECYLPSDAELGSEVDRKAGEFIAKFKEQIRLQKSSSSVKGYNGW